MGTHSLTILSTSRANSAGTYSMCAQCPASKNCCTRVQAAGAIDVPVLVPEDVLAIEQLIGQNKEVFSIEEPGNNRIRRLKSGSQGCIFHVDNKCTIYEIRPLDCRLFPFDIIEKADGHLYWIAYTALCPISHDPKEYFGEVKPLLSKLAQYLSEYARVHAPGMREQPYIELAEVTAD